MRVLAIATHPDDETLGCGATLLKHTAAGDEVHWLIMTTAHGGQWSEETARRKAAEVDTVTRAYGFRSHRQLELPAARLDTVAFDELIAPVREFVAAVRPETVYVVHGGDVHSDHQITFDAVMSVVKPFHMGTLGVERVLSYETLSSTDAAPVSAARTFLPTVFTDVSPYLERKLDIMALYETETQAEPMPRAPSAIRALARYRGATINVEYAEAFMLIRELT